MHLWAHVMRPPRESDAADHDGAPCPPASQYINLMAGSADFLAWKGMAPIVVDSWGHGVQLVRQYMWLLTTPHMGACTHQERMWHLTCLRSQWGLGGAWAATRMARPHEWAKQGVCVCAAGWISGFAHTYQAGRGASSLCCVAKRCGREGGRQGWVWLGQVQGCSHVASPGLAG
eukprot:31089-Chlamydomonas_euryale.AAC.2